MRAGFLEKESGGVSTLGKRETPSFRSYFLALRSLLEEAPFPFPRTRFWEEVARLVQQLEWDIIRDTPMVKTALVHAGVFLLMLMLAIGAVRFLGVSTDVIRDVPLLYFFYISIVLIFYGVRRQKRRRKERK
jgi:hypothetical protein